MYLTEKRDGRIKGHGCADGRSQRAYTDKDAASSPTVAIEAIMLSCIIDAKEKRDVAMVDIPGAFMQADMDELVHVKIEGTMAELLAKMDPKLCCSSGHGVDPTPHWQTTFHGTQARSHPPHPPND